MTYTSSFTIGSADDDDYATLQLWFDDVRGSLGNGEHALATLVPSGPGDSFDWYAARYFGDNTHYTVSGNATPNDFTSYRVDNDGINSFNNDGGDAGQHSTFNAIGISFAPSSSSNELIRVNANPANEGDITFTFDRCQFDQTYPGISTRRIINDNRFNSLSSTYTFEFNNCVIKSDDTGRVYASYFISPASSFTVTRYVGCTFDLPQNTKVGSIDPANPNVVHTVEVSGCLLNLDDFYSKKTGNVLSGVSVDNITRQSSADHADTFNDVTNATYDATFNYGTAPAAGEVSFNATSPNTYQYPTFEGDYTLYDDSNNLAFNYVTNALPSDKDLSGVSRGARPFDAGALEFNRDPFTSSVTVGPGQDYATIALAHNQLRHVIADREHYLYTLVPSSFDYAGVLQWADLRSFTSGNNVEITVSGNTSGTDPFSYCVEPTSFHRFESNNGGDKTFNFVGISFVASGPQVNRGCMRVSENGLEGDMTINVTNCKADFSLGAGTTGRIEFLEDRRSTNLSSIFTYNITNLQLRVDGRGMFRSTGGSESGNTLINVVGSTLHANDGRHVIDSYNKAGHNFETNLSGCLVYSNNSPYEVVDTNSEVANFSGTAIDCIFSEASSNTAVWAPNNRQNVTYGASFFFDTTATGEGDNVYFEGTNTTFTHDYRLYDDPYNLAIGYVSSVTLPSLDLAGVSRGTSPFEAGAFAIDDSGGGGDFPPESGGVALPLTFAYRININD